MSVRRSLKSSNRRLEKRDGFANREPAGAGLDLLGYPPRSLKRVGELCLMFISPTYGFRDAPRDIALIGYQPGWGIEKTLGCYMPDFHEFLSKKRLVCLRFAASSCAPNSTAPRISSGVWTAVGLLCFFPWRRNLAVFATAPISLSAPARLASARGQRGFDFADSLPDRAPVSEWPNRVQCWSGAHRARADVCQERGGLH